MTTYHTPDELRLAASGGLSGDVEWYTALPGHTPATPHQHTRNEIANAVLEAVPVGWVRTLTGWKQINVDDALAEVLVGVGELVPDQDEDYCKLHDLYACPYAHTPQAPTEPQQVPPGPMEPTNREHGTGWAKKARTLGMPEPFPKPGPYM